MAHIQMLLADPGTPPSGGGAVFDTSSTAPISLVFGGPFSWNHTIGAGSNRFLLVAVAATNSDVVSSVTYNGIGLTSLGAHIMDGNLAIIQLFSLSEASMPAAGSHSIQVSGSAARSGAMAASFSSVNQGTPFTAYTTQNPILNPVTMSSNVGDIPVFFMFEVSGGSYSTTNNQIIFDNSFGIMAAVTEVGASSVNIGYTTNPANGVSMSCSVSHA